MAAAMVSSGEAIYPQLPDASTTIDAQSGSYVVTIPGYSQLADKKWHSETFTVGGHKWRVQHRKRPRRYEPC